MKKISDGAIYTAVSKKLSGLNADELISDLKYNKEQMKLGVLFARNHLIGAYRANFIDCDLKEFAQFMNLLSHVARESIDIELMMDDVLACNKQAEEWIELVLRQYNE